MDDVMIARIQQMSEEEHKFAQDSDIMWNHLWLIQARQAVLLERILAKLETPSNNEKD